MPFHTDDTEHKFQSREAASRLSEEEPEFIYRPQNAMRMPDLGPHMHLRWVRARSAAGAWDDKNLSGYFSERWRTVAPHELPDDFIAQSTPFNGTTVVMRGDLVLMVTSKIFADAHKKYYSDLAKQSVAESDALQGQLSAGDRGKLPTVSQDRGSKVQYGARRG